MDTNKTFSFMILICLVTLGLYFFFFSQGNKNSAKDLEEDLTESSSEPREDRIVDFSGKNAQFSLVDVAQTEEADLVFENDNIKIVFNPNDAIITTAIVKDTFLKRETVNEYDLVQARADSDEGALKLKFGSWENDLSLEKLTGGKNFYNYKREGNNFTFFCKIKRNDSDEIYTITKKYEFLDNENVFRLTVDISNENNIPIVFDNSGLAFSVAWGPLLGVYSRGQNAGNVDLKREAQYNMFVYLKDSKIENVLLKSKIMKSSNNNFATKIKEGNEGFVGGVEHYFANIIIPDNQNYKYFFDYRNMSDANFYTGLSRNTKEKSKLTSTFYIYLGPKSKLVTKKYDNFSNDDFILSDTKLSKLDESKFFGIDTFIEWLLRVLYNLVKNYGLAILLLTLIIKVVLSPLTHKSMVSQAKMSKLQPKLTELQKKYKDNPEALNRETMELYKREKINPLGGCLPLLLQMPILMAMYQLLDRMVDLKGASFLFIKDLSRPDNILPFSFTIPFVNISSLNILPIIMTLVSILSTFLMPEARNNASSNKQAQIMLFGMPVLFLFLFYNVSSALVLYWTFMNFLTMFQQIYISYFRKKDDSKIETVVHHKKIKKHK